MKEKFIEIFGWYGAIAILLAYAAISFSFLRSDSILYHVLSGTGAAGIVTVALSKKDYQSMSLNVIYGLISVISIINILN